MTNLASIVTIGRSLKLCSSVSYQPARTYAAGYWNKDWRPGPVPKTEYQRRAAAKKYNLIPEDYKCYPDDGTGYGDYPMLPIVSAESRDPHYNYDMDEYKRNFGEPMHVDCNMHGEDRLDYSRRHNTHPAMMWVWFLGTWAIIGVLYWIGDHIKVVFVKKMPKQWPGDGKKHYTFELE